eukprot:CCRYP_020612-RB/>CCRYP_020612-RB protein AED:0.29 eAED:0.29 QI:331/1/1/1/0.5/0.33/3/206/169
MTAMKHFNYVEDDERRWYSNHHENHDCVALVPYIAPPKRKSPLTFFPPPPLPSLSSSSKQTHSTNPHLTTDVIPQILSYCDAQTLSRASIVCRSWYIMANCDTLWNRLCRHHFGVEAEELRPKPDPTRKLYVLSYRKMRAVCYSRDLVGRSGGVWLVSGDALRGVVQSV